MATKPRTRGISRLPDESSWIRVQRKTFTRFVNNTFAIHKRDLSVTFLEQDMADGILLHALLECLTGEKIYPVPKKTKIKLQKIENINSSLNFLKTKGIKIVGIGAEDIHDCKEALFYGLLWTILCKFQISTTEETGEVTSTKQMLLDWCNSELQPQGLPKITNFTENWQDGKAFGGLVNSIAAGTIDLSEEIPPEKALNSAFEQAEKIAGIPKFLDSSDVIDSPDEISNMTYISYFRTYKLTGRLTHVVPTTTTTATLTSTLTTSTSTPSIELRSETRNDDDYFASSGKKGGNTFYVVTTVGCVLLSILLIVIGSWGVIRADNLRAMNATNTTDSDGNPDAAGEGNPVTLQVGGIALLCFGVILCTGSLAFGGLRYYRNQRAVVYVM